MDYEALLKRKRQLDKMIKRGSDKTRAATDEFLQENVNQPLSDAGFPNVGAGLSAVGSSVVETFTPEDSTDAALSMIPNVPVGSSFRGMSAVSDLDKMNEVLEQGAKRFGRDSKQYKALEDAFNNADNFEQFSKSIKPQNTIGKTDLDEVNRVAKKDEQLKAFYSKQNTNKNVIVHDANSTKNLPRATENARGKDMLKANNSSNNLGVGEKFKNAMFENVNANREMEENNNYDLTDAQRAARKRYFQMIKDDPDAIKYVKPEMRLKK
jgi:hypothetical protein